MIVFREGLIEGVVARPLKKYNDGRGWLMELFRSDEVETEYAPAMAYMSVTRPGVARGPHEHIGQADYFCFAGPSDFKVYLWDNRPESATYMNRQTIIAGETSPMMILVPKRVVHAYRNIGEKDGLVINCPNRLYKGKGRKEEVDEVRHEEKIDSPFVLD